MLNFEKYISESLWANIAAKRARGEKPAKPGEKGYPKTLGVKEEIDEGDTGYKPGWMLKKDPELAKKVKDKTDLAKKRQASYGNPAAGKSVKEDTDQLDELSKETLGSYKHKAELSIPADDREYKNRSKGIDRAEKKLKEEIVAEGAVKDLMMDLRAMPAKEFEAKYKMTKAKARAEMRPSSVAEAGNMKKIQIRSRFDGSVLYSHTSMNNTVARTVLAAIADTVALASADLRGADLRGIDLRRGEFQGADLRNADLRNTDLRGTDLRNADLFGANVLGAKKSVKEEVVAEGLQQTLRKYVPGYAKKQIDNKIKDQQFTQLMAKDGDLTDPQNQKDISQTRRNIRRLNKVGQQGVAEATGDKHFDTIMSAIKKGTSKQATADRQAKKADSQQRARDAFGPSPAAGLGIRKPSVKEDVGQIDELSKKTLGSYVKKSGSNVASLALKVGQARDTEKSGKDIDKMFKRKAGHDKAVNRLTKEETEQLDELSPNLLHRYVKKAAGNMGMHAVDHGKYGDQQKDKKSINKAAKRLDGITNASARMADKANRYDESEINDLAAEYINENNITLEELENMTEEELNELIGAAVGGAFKLGAKAVVGAARLAGRLAKKSVVNKKGNFRFGAQGKADAEKSALDKEKAKDKAIRDRARFAKERQALRDKQNDEKQSNN